MRNGHLSTESRQDPDATTLLVEAPDLQSQRHAARNTLMWCAVGALCLFLGMLSTIAISWISVGLASTCGTDGGSGVGPNGQPNWKDKPLPIVYGSGNWLVSHRSTITPSASGDEIILRCEFCSGFPFRTIREVRNSVLATSVSASPTLRASVDTPGWQILWSGVAWNSVLFAGIWFLVLYVRTARQQWRAWIARRHAGRCPQCGYDLRGQPRDAGGCPECGWERDDRRV
jgi:hypothetical protein